MIDATWLVGPARVREPKKERGLSAEKGSLRAGNVRLKLTGGGEDKAGVKILR